MKVAIMLLFFHLAPVALGLCTCRKMISHPYHMRMICSGEYKYAASCTGKKVIIANMFAVTTNCSGFKISDAIFNKVQLIWIPQNSSSLCQCDFKNRRPYVLGCRGAWANETSIENTTITTMANIAYATSGIV